VTAHAGSAPSKGSGSDESRILGDPATVTSVNGAISPDGLAAAALRVGPSRFARLGSAVGRSIVPVESDDQDKAAAPTTLTDRRAATLEWWPSSF